MNNSERSFDEALDDIDRWSEQLVRELEGLTPDETDAYFKRAQAELEAKLGRPLKLPIRRAAEQEKVS